MARFFVKPEDICGDVVCIRGEDVIHIRNVLRLSPGKRLVACDGIGSDYVVEIDRIEQDCIYSCIIEKKKNNTEPPIEVTLYQGIPKLDKMDYIIQKSVELGVKRIVPMITERTVVRFGSRKDMEKRAIRWSRIALEAAKQSNRGIIPQVNMPMGFREAVELASNDKMCIMPYEKETTNSLRDCLKTDGIDSISIVIGPEGGFSESEAETARLKNIATISLGRRILRTETAGIAVLAIIMYQAGDIGY